MPVCWLIVANQDAKLYESRKRYSFLSQHQLSSSAKIQEIKQNRVRDSSQNGEKINGSVGIFMLFEEFA